MIYQADLFLVQIPGIEHIAYVQGNKASSRRVLLEVFAVPSDVFVNFIVNGVVYKVGSSLYSYCKVVRCEEFCEEFCVVFYSNRSEGSSPPPLLLLLSR